MIFMANRTSRLSRPVKGFSIGFCTLFVYDVGLLLLGANGVTINHIFCLPCAPVGAGDAAGGHDRDIGITAVLVLVSCVTWGTIGALIGCYIDWLTRPTPNRDRISATDDDYSSDS
jgi:hypothetical protein